MIINKYLKSFSPKGNNIEYKSTALKQGIIGIKSLEKGNITIFQYKAIKHYLRRFFKKYQGRIWYRIFPEIFLTKKPLGNARMGKGKGAIDKMGLYVRKGQIILEVNIKNRNSLSNIMHLLSQCQQKLSLKSKVFKQIK